MANSAPRHRKPLSTPYLRLLSWQGSDGELIGLVRDADLKGRVRFFERFGREVTALVRALVGPSTAYRALAERSLLEAYQQVFDTKDVRNLSALVHRTTVRVVRRYQRQTWLLGWLGRRSDALENETDHNIRILYEELQMLPPGERLALCLRHVAGRSLSDTAMLLGCSTSKLRRRLHTAEARLAPAISAHLPADLWAADIDASAQLD
jgi:DNA-directed RNA polymerase specialized sigma24 family protein